MKKPGFRLLARLAIVSACVTGALSVRAGMDIDFGASVNFGSDTDLFLRISSRYFDRERPVVDSWRHQLTNPDDTAVFFFLCRHSGKSPDALYALRRQGLSWFEIGLRVGVPVDAWFVAVTTDPGPPFAKPYGRYKKHKKQRSRRFHLTDDDCRNLVSVRILHEYYGISSEAAIRLRSSGRDVSTLLCTEYDERHGKGRSASMARPRRGSAHDDRSDRDDKSARHHH